MPVKFHLETRYDIKVLRVSGVLGEMEGLELISQVNELLEGLGDSLVVDLSDVPTLNSAGIGALVRIQAQANTQEQSVFYAGPSPLIRGVLAATRLDKFLRVYPSVEDALQSVGT